MIERVEEFEPELQALAFMNGDLFYQRQIPVVQAGSFQNASAGITECAVGGNDKRAGVEPFFGSPLIAGKHSTAESIRADKRVSGVADISGNFRRERLAR